MRIESDHISSIKSNKSINLFPLSFSWHCSTFALFYTILFFFHSWAVADL